MFSYLYNPVNYKENSTDMDDNKWFDSPENSDIVKFIENIVNRLVPEHFYSNENDL